MNNPHTRRADSDADVRGVDGGAPRYRLVIFDFDGTLADSFPTFARLVNGLAAEFDFRPVEAHEVDDLRMYGAREVMRRLGVPVWKVPQIAHVMRRRMAEHIGEIPLFDGVDDVLVRLKRMGLTLAIVSSNSEENVRHVLGRGAVPLIDVYECGASLFGKRARLARTLRRCGVVAPDAICVGDEIRDIEAARGAGIAAGAVAWGYTRLEALRAQSPDEVFLAVADIVRRLGAR